MTAPSEAPDLPAQADPDELALIAAGFPGFWVWRQTVLDRTRYVALGRDLNTHPHTVVTSDLEELAATLAASRPASDQPSR